MADELKEVIDIVEADEAEPETKRTMEGAIQALWHHQVVYSDMQAIAEKTFAFMVEHRGFLARYFAAAGLQFAYDPDFQMCSVAPVTYFNLNSLRLKKDESEVAIALRKLHAQGAATSEKGKVECDVQNVVSMISRFAGGKPRTEERIKEILSFLEKKGCVKMLPAQEDDESGRVAFVILPGIRILVGDAYLEAVVALVKDTDVPLAPDGEPQPLPDADSEARSEGESE